MNLPLPGTIRWCEWRKSGLTIETWLAKNPAETWVAPPAPPPAAPEPPAAPTAPRLARVDPGATSPSTDPMGNDHHEGGNDLHDGIWAGFEYYEGGPMPINPDLDPHDHTRSHPSGGPLSTPAPSQEMRQELHNHAQRKANPRRVRKDTGEMQDNSWW